MIVFGIAWYFFSSLYIIGHSYYWPYFQHFNFNDFYIVNARVPELILDKILNVYFPLLFNQSSHMFRSNSLGIFLQIAFFLILIFLFSKSFFLFREEKDFKNILKRKEDILLFALTFSLLILPFIMQNTLLRILIIQFFSWEHVKVRYF